LANEKKSVTWDDIRWLVVLGVVFFGFLFILNAQKILTLEVAINYTVFIMAFIGLVLSLVACWLSYMAYLDGKLGLKEVMRKLEDLPGKIQPYVNTGKTPTEVTWGQTEKKK
jgi:hypothetical protein